MDTLHSSDDDRSNKPDASAHERSIGNVAPSSAQVGRRGVRQRRLDVVGIATTSHYLPWKLQKTNATELGSSGGCQN
jgi:hypothetical protein